MFYSEAEKISVLGCKASHSYISDIENNRRAIGAKTAKALARVFKRPIEDFLESK